MPSRSILSATPSFATTCGAEDKKWVGYGRRSATSRVYGRTSVLDGVREPGGVMTDFESRTTGDNWCRL